MNKNFELYFKKNNFIYGIVSTNRKKFTCKNYEVIVNSLKKMLIKNKYISMIWKTNMEYQTPYIKKQKGRKILFCRYNDLNGKIHEKIEKMFLYLILRILKKNYILIDSRILDFNLTHLSVYERIFTFTPYLITISRFYGIFISFLDWQVSGERFVEYVCQQNSETALPFFNMRSVKIYDKVFIKNLTKLTK